MELYPRDSKLHYWFRGLFHTRKAVVTESSYTVFVEETVMGKKIIDTSEHISEKYEKTAVKVSLVSIIGNSLLSLFKLLAGVIASSGAMISDAVHSASDVFSSIIVILGVKIAARESDDEHQYGHERFECVAAIVLAVILCIVGLFIGHTAIENLSSDSADKLQTPGMLALIAAVVSIVCKEGMYWYTRIYAKRLNSSGLMAEAWHHRSDALSSIGALMGIWGARMGYPWLMLWQVLLFAHSL